MNKQQLLLIEPPYYRLFDSHYSLDRFPFSLAYLAGAVRQQAQNWDVAVYNADFTPESRPPTYQHLAGQGFNNYLEAIKNPQHGIWAGVSEIIKKQAPKVVGITAKSQNIASAAMTAKLVKEALPQALVVLGGPHASMVGEKVLEYPDIDLVVVGEGELTMVEILQAIDEGKGWQGINGLIFRDNKSVVVNPARELMNDLDGLPFPVDVARTCLLDYQAFPKEAFKNLFTIRGCPNRCAFCGSYCVWTRRVRPRTIGNILDEIKAVTSLGIDEIHFDDDTFGVKKSMIKELCAGIRESFPGLRWSCEIHVNLVEEDVMAEMARAGCFRIQLGVESGNNQMLKTIRKGITIERAIKAAKIIKKNNIFLEGFFIVGFPTETGKTLEDTISAMMAFPSDKVVYSIFTPYPGTELYNYCMERGIVDDTYDVALHNHHSPLNYFCPELPKEVFHKRLRKLERDIDRRNSRKQLIYGLKKNLSRRGISRIRRKGIKHFAGVFVHHAKTALRR